MTPLRVLITGASGFVGRHLTAQLTLAGHSVLGVSRDPEKARQGSKLPIQWVTLDQVLNDLGVLHQVDSIVHLAGESVAEGRWTEERKKKILNSRVESTQELVHALARTDGRRPKTLVCASAIGIYGDQGETVLDENSPPGTGFLAEVCTQWEAQALKAQALGLRVCSVRIGVVLGHEGALPKMAIPIRTGLGGKLGSGSQWMSWIHVEDLASVMVSALQDERYSGSINAVAPSPIRNADFIDRLARVLGRPTWLPVPRFALTALLGEMSQIILASQRIVPARLSELGFKYTYGDLGEAFAQIFPPSGAFSSASTAQSMTKSKTS